MDVLRIFDNNSLGSYYKFLVKYEEDYKVRLSGSEEKVIEFISKKLASGKRIHELELLKRMIVYRHGLLGVLKDSLDKNYKIALEKKSIENVVNVMTNEFPTGSGKKTYSDCVFLQKEEQTEDYRVSDSFREMLENPEFRIILQELVEFGIMRYRTNYSHRYQDTNLVLYQKYTYEDHFVSSSVLIAISKQSRTKESEDVQNFLYAEQRGIKVELFVRKNKDDKISKEFYYLGRMKATGRIKEFVMVNTSKTAVEIEWMLDTPVREDIYEYIVKG